MADLTLSDISEKMRDIDFCMLATRGEGGHIGARPMSNNRDVEFEGDTHFFAYDSARSVADIGRDPNVSLGFQGKAGLLGTPPVFISVIGRAELIRDKAAFEAHWNEELNYWFKDGIDTPGTILIKVHASRIHYWDGSDEAEIVV